MKLSRLVSAATLSLLLGSAAFVCAQNEQNEPKPPEPRPEATKPKQDEGRTPRQDEAKPPKQNRQDEVKPPKEQERNSKPEQRAEQPEHQGQQHAASRGSRIPEEKFHSQFGRPHSFKVNRVTEVEGQPRFQYGGYWFTLVDAWPAEWAYTDDCYIDEIDGEYFLFDLLHPGVRIEVFVVM